MVPQRDPLVTHYQFCVCSHCKILWFLLESCNLEAKTNTYDSLSTSCLEPACALPQRNSWDSSHRKQHLVPPIGRGTLKLPRILIRSKIPIFLTTPSGLQTAGTGWRFLDLTECLWIRTSAYLCLLQMNVATSKLNIILLTFNENKNV